MGSPHNVLKRNTFEARYEISDPGDAGAIIVDRNFGLVPLVTGASGETRTLAAPSKSGLRVTLAMQVDGGGDCVVTVASAVDEAGSTVLTFANQGEVIGLESIAIGTVAVPVYVWRVYFNDSVAGVTAAIGSIVLGDSETIAIGAGGQVTLSTDGTDGTVDNGAATILAVGGSASLVAARSVLTEVQAAPIAETTATTLTASELLTQLITGTHTAGADVDYTLPLGSAMDTGFAGAINDSFEFTLINLSAALADTITLTANTGFTIVGRGLVDSAHVDSEFPSSATFRVRKTAADTFVAYRV